MIYEQIKAVTEIARRRKDAEIAALLQCACADFEMAIKNKQDNLTEVEEMAVLGRILKQNQESIDGYNQGKQYARVAVYTNVRNILSVFVPKKATEEEIRAAAKSIDMTMKFGDIMKAMKEKLGGDAKVDGALLSKTIKDIQKEI